MQNNMQSIEAYLQENAKLTPERPAVIVKDRVVSYSEFWGLVHGFANYLKKECNIKKADRIVVKTSQTLSYAITYFGVHLSGAIFVPLEKLLPEEKCAEIIAETEASLYISKKATSIDGVKNILIENIEALAEQGKDTSADFLLPINTDSADIMFTTGTTGKAKGVEVTHSVLLATAENYITGFEMKKDTVIAVPGPLNHVNALRKLYVSIMNGSTIVILDGLMSMRAFYNALDNQGVNALCLPPASCRMVWKLSKDKLAEYANQIDFVEVSTAPVTESDKSTLRRQLPNSRLYNNYGLSECGAMVMYDFNEYPNQPVGCVGKPMVNSHVVIVDDNRQEISSSKTNMGLIANKGPINMKGYYRAPEITAQTMENGFVYTCDIGYFDEEGFLYVIGRNNDTINVGGLKVEPTEVEEATLSVAGIEDCICVPVKNPVTENVLKLFVVIKSGSTFDADYIIQCLSDKLEKFQVPAMVEQIKSVPKNYVGKPDRKAFDNGVLRQ